MLNWDSFCISLNQVGGGPPLNSTSVGDYFFLFRLCDNLQLSLVSLSKPVLSINLYLQKWVALAEKVCEISQSSASRSNFVNNNPGGKAKPLKAAKKEKKELDDDELAYKEKLRAGM